MDVSGNLDGPITNDVADSNPVGRTASDTTALKLRNDLLRIGTWNVRTLYKAGSFVNLISEWIVMSLSEVRWTGFGMMSEEDRVLVFSGGEKHVHGVGFMLTTRVARSLLGYLPVSDRVIMIKLQGKSLNVVCIQAYAPTSDHSDEELEKFYDDISEALRHVRSGDVLIAVGD